MLNCIVINPLIGSKLDYNLKSYKESETVNLASAIGLSTAHVETFYLKKPSSGYLLRSGKIKLLKDIIDNLTLVKKIDLLIFSIDISAIQQRNLERIFSKKILDKTSLILEIFGKRAMSREGTIQVELAHLNWQKSRLVRSWTHLERQRGGFGFLGGPGESQIELDKRLISKRIKQLKFMIEKIKKTRKIQYQNRKNTRTPIISLLGYTNAGKSTLFNYLTKLSVKAENKLFETLDTKVSYLFLPNVKKAFISDTVGFISDLPTLLIEAFKSTLEEIKSSDLLIHVRDSCAENTDSQKLDVINVLKQLKIFPNTLNGPPMIEVMNKIDINKIKNYDNLKYIKNRIYISAKTGEGIKTLKNKIDEILSKNSNI